ncbi:MAG TPA: hypothetical protein DCY79_14780 [Planctomycetaceae bacterium]|nr:hypothetical protein [Blastopirellula sp.]HAY81068.1 hypothetical protein [Planctomycetaceae bacterium]
MSKHPYLISRRHLLRGAGNIALGLPLLEIMSPAIASPAASAPATAKRLCVLYKGCGVYPHAWDIASGTETEFELSSLLQPLKQVKDDVLILRNLDHVFGKNNGGHLVAPSLSMTGALPDKRRKSYHSIDQIVADEIGDQTPVKSLQLTADSLWKQHPWINYLSHDSEGNPIPPDRDPGLVFDKLFRGMNNQQYRSQTRSVLDALKESSQGVLQKASVHDRKVLAQYFDSIRNVEKQLDSFEDSADTKRNARLADVGDFAIDANLGGKIKAMLDLIALSFWTDTTRVATMMMANTNSRCTYGFLGLNEEMHYMSHYVRNRGILAGYNTVNQWHTAKFAYLVEKLKSYREGDGTLLDNSIIMYMSGIKHGDYHTLTDIPVVLAGRGGGQLAPGRHVRYPEPTPFPNLLLTLANMLGADRDQLGESTGTLPGLSEPAGYPMSVVDDGSWKITKQDDKHVEVKGLLLVSDDINDTNAYYLQLSDKSRLEIRVPFMVVHKLVFDARVGRVVSIKGTWGMREGRKVISGLEYQTP